MLTKMATEQKPRVDKKKHTHLEDLCVWSEAIKQEADNAHVSAVQHQLLWSELQRGVRGHQLGSVWAHCQKQRRTNSILNGDVSQEQKTCRAKNLQSRNSESVTASECQQEI